MDNYKMNYIQIIENILPTISSKLELQESGKASDLYDAKGGWFVSIDAYAYVVYLNDCCEWVLNLENLDACNAETIHIDDEAEALGFIIADVTRRINK